MQTKRLSKPCNASSFSCRLILSSCLTQSRLPSSAHRELISCNITFIIGVSFHPLEIRPYSKPFPFFNFPEDVLNKIAILHCLSSRVLPVVASPALKPFRQTFDRVVGVGDDDHIPIPRNMLYPTLYCSELRPLVCLSRSTQGLGDVA